MENEMNKYQWLHQPDEIDCKSDRVTFTTNPKTDFWQRTYYGFQNDNGHIYAFETKNLEFSYSVLSRYLPKKIYDQGGIIVYLDSENWFKASIEFENATISRLGSVVTNIGFSDWATTDIPTQTEVGMYYRLSRRNKDFLVENSFDGTTFIQMRIFHLHKAMSRIKIGIYACSPSDSSFEVTFSDFKFGDCLWDKYE